MPVPSWLPPPLGEGWGGGTTAIALLIALAIDRWFGEPASRWHPVAWIGQYLGWMGKRFAPRDVDVLSKFKPFVFGALAWCLGAVAVCLIALGVQRLAALLPGALAALLVGVALKPLLAWRMLRDEVLAVDAALAASLDAGRARLVFLVSRDVDALTASEVRESAIESLAENLNDSVVAPVFWFLLLGLPGAALYRFANTADAMWGYRGTREGRRWEWAGKWAARADDGLSWLPARLTALLLILGVLGGELSQRPRFGVARLIAEARKTPSPNSGWPMAAMALLLDVRLGKPGVYTLHAAGRGAAAQDVRRATSLGARVVVLLAAIAVVAAVVAISFAGMIATPIA